MRKAPATNPLPHPPCARQHLRLNVSAIRKNTVILVVALLLATFANQSFAALLTTSSQYTIQFASLPSTGQTGAMDETWVSFPPQSVYIDPNGQITLGPSPFDAGTARFDIYENNSDATPVYSYTSSPGLIAFVVTPGTGLEGELVISVLSGTVNLDWVGIEVDLSGDVYSEQFPVSAVPVPPSGLLLLGGLLGCPCLVRSFRKGAGAGVPKEDSP